MGGAYGEFVMRPAA